MPVDFRSPVLDRCYRVDDDGVSLLTRDGVARSVIRWEQFACADAGAVSSVFGEHIAVRLDNDARHEFLNLVLAGWRTRFPAAFWRNEARRRRSCRRALLLTAFLLAAPVIVGNVTYWALGSPAELEGELSKLNRVFVFSIMLLGPQWLYYCTRLRAAVWFREINADTNPKL